MEGIDDRILQAGLVHPVAIIQQQPVQKAGNGKHRHLQQQGNVRGLLYPYFPGKEALVAAVIAREYANYSGRR